MNRAEYNKKLQELVKEFSQGYQEQAKQLSDELLSQMNKGLPIDQALTQSLKVVPLLDTMKTSIVETVFTAACYGFGIIPKMAANPEAIQKVVADVPWSMDGVPLSARLHGAGNTMRQEIESTLKQAFKNQKSFTEAARKLYDGYGYGHVTNKVPLPDYILNVQRNAKRVVAGDQEAYFDFLKALKKATKQVEKLAQNNAPTRALKAGYQEFLQSVQKLTQKGIERAVRIAVEEKSRYIAERIARTESARRYYQGERARYDNDPQVVAYEWTLSSRHAQLPYDICDMYAHADLYGLGPGIYPKDKMPQIPVHPHCMCSFLPVFVGSKQNSKRLEFSTVNAAIFRPNAVNDFLRHIPYSKSRALLGADGWQKWRITGEWQGALKGWPGISKDNNPFKKDWFNVQRFAESDNRLSDFRDKMAAGKINLHIKWKDQNKHIFGSKAYNLYVKQLEPVGFKPSIVTVDADELVRNYAGKAPDDHIKFYPGEPLPREEHTSDKVIGKAWDNNQNGYVDTQHFTIVYSRHGVHIYPRLF